MSKAFLLTRQAQDTSHGIQLELWFSSDHGPLQVLINQQRAVFFITQADIDNTKQLLQNSQGLSNQFEIKTLQLKNFSFEPMAAIYCNSLHAFYRIRDILKENLIDAFETDIRPPERYLTERFITGPVTINNPDKTKKLINPAIKPDNYAPKLRLMSVDIETAYDSNELYSIAYICNDNQQV